MTKESGIQNEENRIQVRDGERVGDEGSGEAATFDGRWAKVKRGRTGKETGGL